MSSRLALAASRPALLALAAGAALALAACGEESDGTFEHEGFPFTFSYPEDFEEVDDVQISQELGANADDRVAVGLEENDLITVERFTLNIPIDVENLRLAKREIDGLLSRAGPDSPTTAETEVAGFPALTANDVAISAIEGAVSEITIIFDGDQEYVINCQSTPDHRDEIDAACDQALETLTFG